MKSVNREIEEATYTIVETARILRIGRNEAYQAAHCGELPVIRIGRRLLVPRAALERLVAKGGRPQAA
jgi:excisionase family DNA binding protein